jgi:DNA-binding response OmpR family regulator
MIALACENPGIMIGFLRARERYEGCMALAAVKKAKVRVRRPEDLERVSILAIEGMMPMMGILSGILHSFRFQSVNVLGNSNEAWARLTADSGAKPDIILLDWNAHPVNGETFVRQLRRVDNPAVAETPVVATLANVDRETVFAVRDAGVNVILLRPFSAAQLLDKVMWTLGQDTPFIRSDFYVGPDRRRFRAAEYLGEKRRIGETDHHSSEGPDRR